jgi:EmrB/QacA subfamily drug resistance transporter
MYEPEDTPQLATLQQPAPLAGDRQRGSTALVPDGTRPDTPPPPAPPPRPTTRTAPPTGPPSSPPSQPPRAERGGAEDARTVHTANWPIALAVVTIGAFMSILDISIVNVAIPTMRNQFGVSTSDIEWITTAYSLALGVIVPVSGWLGERFGLERVYAFSVCGFGLASALCGLAWDLNSEVAFRILQAIPGGILPVITLTMLYRLVPPEKIGLGMAAYGLSMVIAPATGPTLGGYLVEYHSWRMIFFLNVPIGLIGTVLAVMLLPRFPRGETGRFDTWGFVTVASGLFALLLALSKGEDWGWGSYRVLGLLGAATTLLAVFVIIELEVERPLLNLRLFKIWSFTNCQLLVGILSSAFFTVLFYVPLFLQQGQGITPLNTGLTMLPEAIGMAIALPMAGLLYTEMGPRWPITIGMALTAYGTYLLCGISSSVSRSDVMFWTSLRGMGQAFCMVPLMTAGLAEVPSAQLDGASAINNVMQRVTGALGLAILTTLVTKQNAQIGADRGALVPSSAMQTDPRILAMQQQGPRGMLPYFELWELKIQAATYGNLFLLLATVTLSGTFLALTFSSEKPTTGPHHLDIGI